MEKVIGRIESQYSLRIRAKVVGEATLTFCAVGAEAGVEPHEGLILPATLAQMDASLVRAEAYEEDLENREHGIGVIADLSNFEIASR